MTEYPAELYPEIGTHVPLEFNCWDDDSKVSRFLVYVSTQLERGQE